MEAASERYYDTLRLTDRQRQVMVRKLAEPRHQSVDYDERADERLAFNARPAMVHMHHPGGSTITYVIWPRDLSNTGMGFLHGSFCYTDTRLTVLLKKIEGGQVRIAGRVVRCQLLKGTVHEIGVRFDQAIEVHDFVDLGWSDSDASDGASDALPRLTGRVLALTASEDDRQLIQFVGQGVGLKIDAAATAADAEQTLQKHEIDLMVIDAALPCDAAAAIHRVRGMRPDLPILVLSDDAEDAGWSEAGAAEVLIKPFDYHRFVEALGRYLGRNHRVRTDRDPLVSEHWSNPRMRPLILGYLERLEDRLGDLRKQVLAGSEETVRTLRDMKGSAGGYGYPRITEAASKLLRLVAPEGQIDPEARQSEQVRQTLDELESLAAAACQIRRQSA